MVEVVLRILVLGIQLIVQQVVAHRYNIGHRDRSHEKLVFFTRKVKLLRKTREILIKKLERY
jgi:hypothetical protein